MKTEFFISNVRNFVIKTKGGDKNIRIFFMKTGIGARKKNIRKPLAKRKRWPTFIGETKTRKNHLKIPIDMKTRDFFILPLALGLLATCDDGPADDMIWDFACYEMRVEVVDEAGNDLLNPATAGNILDDSVRVVYGGVSYSRDTNLIQTRYLPPAPLALRYYKVETTGQYRMAFGEFTPTDDHENDAFTIEWGDGTADKVAFDCYISWDGDNQPTVHKKIYLNGEPMAGEDYLVRIVR